MKENLLSRAQRREQRRRAEERPLTLSRFMTKARMAGLIAAGRIKVKIAGSGLVEFVATSIQDDKGVRLSWQVEVLGKLTGFECDIFTIETAQLVIRDLGAGRVPGSGS